MKLRICSDIHLEFRDIELEDAGEDLLILAGDIGINTNGLDFAKAVAAKLDKPVLMIAGNHEFYRNPYRGDTHTWQSTLENLRREADHTSNVARGKVTFLEDSVVEWEGVRFIGATLWTDMQLFGDDPAVRRIVQNAMNDYRVILSEMQQSKDLSTLTTEESIHRHGVSRQFITDTLAIPYDGSTVVITHHTPSAKSVPPMYKNDKVSAGYSSRLEPLIEQYKPTLWCHGHTHTSYDYKIGETRIICNPRGYAGLDPNLDFKIDLIVEV